MDNQPKQLSPPATAEESAGTSPHYPRFAGEVYGRGYGYAEQYPESQIGLHDVPRIVYKRKWLIASVTIIATSLVALQMYRTPSTYKSATLVEIDKETPLQIKQGQLVLDSDNTDTLKTTLLTIKSDPVLQATVRRLELDTNPKFLHPERQKTISEAFSEILGRGEKPAPEAAAAPAGKSSTTAQVDAAVDRVAADLMVDVIRDTNAISISYTSTDPQLAADIANAVARSFIDVRFKGQTEQYTNTSDWLDRSTRELKTGVEQAEQALATYTKEHNIFSADNKGTLTTDKLTHLHDQATRAATDRLLKESMYQEVKAGRVSSLPEAYVDPKLQSIEKTLGDLEKEDAQLSVRYGPRNPKLVEVRQQLAALQQQRDEALKNLQEKLRSDYERAGHDEQALTLALSAAEADAVKENQDAIQFNILKQELDTARGLYTDFLQKTHQANLEVAQQHPNIHVIQPAKKPRVPVGPMRGSGIILAFSISLAVVVGVSVLIERLDNTIKTTEDINGHLQLPALGVIPLIGVTPPQTLAAKFTNRG